MDHALKNSTSHWSVVFPTNYWAIQQYGILWNRIKSSSSFSKSFLSRGTQTYFLVTHSNPIPCTSGQFIFLIFLCLSILFSPPNLTQVDLVILKNQKKIPKSLQMPEYNVMQIIYLKKFF